MWSPAFNKVNKAVEIAAVPEAVTTAPIPPSNLANRCSRISFVGLFNLVYIKPASAKPKRLAAWSELLKTYDVV